MDEIKAQVRSDVLTVTVEINRFQIFIEVSGAHPLVWPYVETFSVFDGRRRLFEQYRDGFCHYSSEDEFGEPALLKLLEDLRAYTVHRACTPLHAYSGADHFTNQLLERLFATGVWPDRCEDEAYKTGYTKYIETLSSRSV